MIGQPELRGEKKTGDMVFLESKNLAPTQHKDDQDAFMKVSKQEAQVKVQNDRSGTGSRCVLCIPEASPPSSGLSPKFITQTAIMKPKLVNGGEIGGRMHGRDRKEKERLGKEDQNT